MASKKKNAKVKKKVPGKIYKENQEVWEINVGHKWKTNQAIYKGQDNPTREAIERVQDRLDAYWSGTIKVGNKEFQLSTEIRDKHTFNVAMRIIADLASFDVRIANYKSLAGRCGTCGKKLGRKVQRKGTKDK